MRLLWALVILVGLTYAQTGFVKVQKVDNLWWFTHGEKMFLTLGINHVNNGGPDDGVGGRETPACQKTYPLCGDTLSFAPALGYAPYFNTTQARYGSTEAWVQSTTSRLKSWGFNSVGGWSAKVVEGKNGLYYAHLLDMLTTWQDHSSLPDIFGQSFADRCDTIAAKECASRAQDPMLLGYQTDNELPWSSDFMAQYLTNASDTYSAGYVQAIKYLETTFNNIQTLNEAWNIQATSFADVRNHLHDKSLNQTRYTMDVNNFLYIVGSQYFAVTTAAIKKYDPNHLLLGCRADVLPDPVLRSLIPYVDVVDLHSYTDSAPIDWLSHTHAVANKPCIVGEFSFTAVDSNMPNTRGARSNHPFATQTERAAAYYNYVKPLLELPFVIGYHWWQWADEPSSGRWPDGEDSNYGVVHIDDDEYEILTNTMTNANSQAEQWHKAGPKKQYKQK